jgi:NAD(P)H-dependent FMN reductase
MKITIISGTNRNESNTLKISKIVQKEYQKLGAETKLLDLSKLPTELFSPNVYGEKPSSFQPFIEAVKSANAIVAVLPEYNGSFPGAFKYFIDMLPFPESLAQKPVACIGLAAGMWGAMRSVEHFQQLAFHLGAVNFTTRVFLPSVFNELNEAGELVSEKTAERITKQSGEFINFVSKLS